MTKSKLCLIDSRITNSHIFTENVNSETFSILIDYKTDTFDSLFNKIKDLTDLDLTLIDSIAYVAHGTFQPTYSFLKNEDTFEMDKKESWEPLFNFLLKFNGLKYFDFLGCNLASNSAWKQVFNWIEDSKGINLINFNVRASTDATGNLVSGGNWILEDGSDSGSVDAKKLYFTNLDSFEGLLVLPQTFVSLDGLYTYTINPINPNTVTLTKCPTKTSIKDVSITNTVTDTNNVIYTVTSIRYSVFDGCRELTSLILPNTLTSIGINAFKSCEKLQSLILPNTVSSMSIENDAFNGCIALQSLILPNTVTSIGSAAFTSCNMLESLILPNSVESIGKNAFFGCNALRSLTLPQNLTSIEEQTFYNCFLLESLTLPTNLKTIGNNAFANCKVLLSIKLPDSVESIGDYAFNNCIKLESLTLPTNLNTIGNNAFASNHLKSIILPDSLMIIGDNVFKNCFALESLTLPKNLTSIGDFAFENCSALTDLILPDSLITIGTKAFYACNSLESVNIPYNLTTIYIPNILDVITIKGIGDYAFTKQYNTLHKTIGYYSKTYGKYIIPDPDTTGLEFIDDKITYIFSNGYATLTGCDIKNSIISVKIPSTITITETNIDYTVRSIGDYAFSDCIALTSLILPDSVESIGENSFYYNSLSSITIPPNINSITFGADAFKKDQGGAPVTAYYTDKFTPPAPLDVNAFNLNSYLKFIPEGTKLVSNKSEIEGLPNGSKIITYNTTNLPSKMVKGVIYTVLKIDNTGKITIPPNSTYIYAYFLPNTFVKIINGNEDNWYYYDSSNYSIHKCNTELQAAPSSKEIYGDSWLTYFPVIENIKIGNIVYNLIGGSILNSSPIAPTGLSAQNFSQGSKVNHLVVTGEQLVYFTKNTNNNTYTQITDDITTTYLIGTTYGVSQTIDGDKLDITVTITSPPCFNENTQILCLKNDIEEYVLVQNLKKGDLVKTYSNSNLPVFKKIVLIGKGELINNPDVWSKCMYKMGDLIVTGGHSILLDELSEKDKEKKELSNRTEMVDDKRLVWAGLSHLFTKLDDKNTYTYYHFVLENEETEDNRLYGVWANGVLVETIKRKDFFAYGLKDMV
jgi:hypothetical protein